MKAASALALLAATATAAGCGPLEPQDSAALPPITAMTFNVHGAVAIDDPVIGPTMAAQISAAMPSFISLQECTGCERLLDRLPPRYQLATAPSPVAVAIAYDSETWELIDDGVLTLGGDDDGWGVREARWARFRALPDGGEVDVYSTHWCVPIRNADDACDGARQVAYADAILADLAARSVSRAIVAGDLNVFDGFEAAPAMARLQAGGLTDTLREISNAEVATFAGNSWAPTGRIDYVLATTPVEVVDAWVDETVPFDQGSDHHPVAAVVQFSAPSPPSY